MALRIVSCPEDAPPFEVDAVAAEEDTWLVLSADPVATEPEEGLEEILAAARQAQPEPPGSVVVLEGRPLRLLAVVHDLSREPTWREEWVASALAAILAECEARGIRSLALPPLGARHGSLAPPRFEELLAEALRAAPPLRLERLWLVVPPGPQGPKPPDTSRTASR